MDVWQTVRLCPAMFYAFLSDPTTHTCRMYASVYKFLFHFFLWGKTALLGNTASKGPIIIPRITDKRTWSIGEKKCWCSLLRNKQVPVQFCPNINIWPALRVISDLSRVTMVNMNYDTVLYTYVYTLYLRYNEFKIASASAHHETE